MTAEFTILKKMVRSLTAEEKEALKRMMEPQQEKKVKRPKPMTDEEAYAQECRDFMIDKHLFKPKQNG